MWNSRDKFRQCIHWLWSSHTANATSESALFFSLFFFCDAIVNTILQFCTCCRSLITGVCMIRFSCSVWASFTLCITFLFYFAWLLLHTGRWLLFNIVMHSFTTGCLPSDLQLWSPEHLIPFDTVCHSGCNCHLLKAFKTIKSFSVLGAWQYISTLIRTLGCQRNCPPRANPAPWGAVPTKLIILCNHTSWNTATAAGKYRFGVKHYNVIPISDLLPPIPTDVNDVQYVSVLLS